MSIIKLSCPACGGSVAFSEGKEIAYCEYCGSELHFRNEVENEQKRHEAEIADLTDRIYQLIASRQFLKAQEAANEGLLKYPYAGRLHLCLLLAEYNLDDPAKLAGCGKDYTQSENYQNCVRTMIEEDRKDLLSLAEENKKTVAPTPDYSAISMSGSTLYAEEERAMRDMTVNTIESKKARIKNIRSSGKNIIEQIKKLSYDPYSDRDIVTYILENGPYIIHFLKPSTLVDEQGNDLRDFVESDDHLYFGEIGKLLNELDKPENATLAQANTEYLNRVKKAVDIWRRLLDMQEEAGSLLCNGDEEPVEEFIDEDEELTDCVNAYNMAKAFIDVCADWKRSITSEGDSDRRSVDKYVTEQNDLLCSYFRTHMKNVDELIPLVEWSESPAAERNFATAAVAAQACASAASTAARSFATVAADTQAGISAAAVGTFGGSVETSRGVPAEKSGKQIRLPAFLRKLDNLCYSPKKRNIKLGIWVSCVAFLLLGITLCVTTVYGWELGLGFGLFIIAVTCIFNFAMISDTIRKRHEVFCPKCKTFYNYSTDIAYREVSRFTKSYSINTNSTSNKPQVCERLFYNIQVDCHCHQCGAARTYTKKINGGEAYTDGTKKFFDPNTAMNNTFANDFLPCTDTRFNLAGWAMGIIAVLLSVILLISAAIGAANRILPTDRCGTYYAVTDGSILTLDFDKDICDVTIDNGISKEYYQNLKYTYFSAKDAQKVVPDDNYQGKRIVIVYYTDDQGIRLWDIGSNKFMLIMRSGGETEVTRDEITFSSYYHDPQDYYKTFRADNGTTIKFYKDGSVETDISTSEFRQYIYVTNEWLSQHVPSYKYEKAIVLYNEGENNLVVCEYIDGNTLRIGSTYYRATGDTEDSHPEPNPDTPDTPDTPDKPDTPDTPDTPDKPEPSYPEDHTHIYGTDNACSICKKPWQYTDGLQYSSNSDGTYTVIGRGSATGAIVVPYGYNGGAVTAIGEGVFQNSSLITSVVLPESVKTIGAKAFRACSLTEITLPSALTDIGVQAFELSGLQSLTIPENMVEIGDAAFSQCNSLQTVYWNAVNCMTVGTQPYIFGENCTSLTKVVIGDAVRSIPAFAFVECTRLSDVTIGKNVSSIGEGAFCGCTALTKVALPESLISIGEAAFALTGLQSVTIPEKVTYIGDSAFSGCELLQTVYWNASNCMTAGTQYTIFNTLIGTEEEYIVVPLKEVVIGDKVQSIPAYAFAYCDQLTNVTIGKNVSSIGEGAFCGCTALTKVALPESLISIGEAAFALTGLQSVTIPEKVTYIGDSAFSGCELLQTVYWNASNCMTAGTQYTIFNTLIGTEEEYIVVPLKEVVIGDKVQSIPAYAFAYCNQLTSVVIGKNVTEIGDDAFYECTSLNTVYYMGDATEWAEIQKGANNSDLSNARVYYYSSSANYDGNHWHYDRDIPTVWKKS